jgi:acyl-CoA thioesterase FadM
VEENDYSLIDDVEPPADTHPPGAHVVDYELQKLLSRGWQRYVAVVREKAGDIPAPVVKQITTTFEAECHGGDCLQRGVRAVSRTRRSYVLEEALWQTDSGQVIAKSRVVMTGIDRKTGRAAEIPAAMWSAVEELEGRAIPVATSPLPPESKRTGGPREST